VLFEDFKDKNPERDPPLMAEEVDRWSEAGRELGELLKAEESLDVRDMVLRVWARVVNNDIPDEDGW
jgi:hypothetical protein